MEELNFYAFFKTVFCLFVCLFFLSFCGSIHDLPHEQTVMMARLSTSICRAWSCAGTQVCHFCIATNCSTLASCGKTSSGGGVGN